MGGEIDVFNLNPNLTEKVNEFHKIIKHAIITSGLKGHITPEQDMIKL